MVQTVDTSSDLLKLARECQKEYLSSSAFSNLNLYPFCGEDVNGGGLFVSQMMVGHVNIVASFGAPGGNIQIQFFDPTGSKVVYTYFSEETGRVTNVYYAGILVFGAPIFITVVGVGAFVKVGFNGYATR